MAEGGTEAHINWMLQRRYYIMVKIRNANRARKLAGTVTQWVMHPKVPDRQIGWVEHPTSYAMTTRQLAIRHRKQRPTQEDEYGYAVLVFNLSDAQLAHLLQRPLPHHPHEPQTMFNALHYYDLRGGGTETQFRGDKQGLGMGHRNKTLFDAQAMLVNLGHLAHNFVIWTLRQLAQVDHRFMHYGVLRMVRDVFQVLGCLHFDADGNLTSVELNPASPFSASLSRAFYSDYV